jgi:hypothetical protein
MADAVPWCAWGWVRPSRSFESPAGQAGGLVKGEAGERRRV